MSTQRGYVTVIAILSAVLLDAQGPILDPIPEQPVASGMALAVEEFAAFPKSSPMPTPVDPRLARWARINQIGEIPDGSRRMFAVDLNGSLFLIERGQPHLYLDVGRTFAPDFFSGRGLGQGFGCIAFHPDFESNGRFYTVHTESGSAIASKVPDLKQQSTSLYHGVVTEWTARNPSAAVFEGQKREVLRLGFAGQVHGIQQIDFNPTARKSQSDYGLLYIAVGDGGQGVVRDVPQDLAMPHGKILRIDPIGQNSANGRYGIPPSNPFVAKSGVLGEIYAYGMRDPHRFSWDTRGSRRLLLGHIGEHAIEAIYEVRAGDNLGWSHREGQFAFSREDRCHLYPLPANDSSFGYTYPIAAYDHDPPPGLSCIQDSGHAVAGGFVYRGRNAPELKGKYVFGDIVNGRMFYTNEREMRRGRQPAVVYELAIVDANGMRRTMQDLAGDRRVDLHIGSDSVGELYLLSKANGKSWRVAGSRRVTATSDQIPLQR